MNRLLQLTTPLLLSLAIVGVALPLVAFAKRAAVRKGVKVKKVKKGTFKNARALGKGAVKAFVFGEGPVAKGLAMNSRVRSKKIRSKLRTFNLKRAKASVAKIKVKAKRGPVVAGLGKLSLKDKKLGNAVSKNLQGRQLHQNMDRFVDGLESLVGKGYYDKLGKAINAGNRAQVQQLL